MGTKISCGLRLLQRSGSESARNSKRSRLNGKTDRGYGRRSRLNGKTDRRKGRRSRLNGKIDNELLQRRGSETARNSKRSLLNGKTDRRKGRRRKENQKKNMTIKHPRELPAHARQVMVIRRWTNSP